MIKDAMQWVVFLPYDWLNQPDPMPITLCKLWSFITLNLLGGFLVAMLIFSK